MMASRPATIRQGPVKSGDLLPVPDDKSLPET